MSMKIEYDGSSGEKPEAEWSEILREWVTVMPSREDKSDTLGTVCTLAYTGG